MIKEDSQFEIEHGSLYFELFILVEIKGLRRSSRYGKVGEGEAASIVIGLSFLQTDGLNLTYYPYRQLKPKL